MDIKETGRTRVVAAVIKRGEHYFCVRRCRSKYTYISEHWEFPGGKVEQGEDDKTALEREIKEELDWQITVCDHIVTIDYNYPDFGLKLAAYTCKAPAEDNFKLLEHTDYCWLTADKLPTLDWTDADAELLKHIK